MSSDPFKQLDDISTRLPASRWMLVGGLMVHAHANLAGITHPRPTVDADLVVELRAGSYAQAATVILSLGYQRHEPLDHLAPFHRFTRGSEHVDLMAPEHQQVTYAGRRVIGADGARSALNRTIPYTTPAGTPIRIPDIASALSLKGAAFHQPSGDRQRHLQDAVTLFACSHTTPLTVSKSMRSNINHLINALDSPEAWSFTAQPHRRRAVIAILQLRPDWPVPGFVLPQRASRAKQVDGAITPSKWEQVAPPTRRHPAGQQTRPQTQSPQR